MKKAAKIRLIILCSILGLILLFFASLGVMYIYAESVVIGHVDISSVPVLEGIETPAEDYPVNYPWFGNPLMMLGGSGGGRSYNLVFERGGDKNIGVYMAVNDPIDLWINYLSDRYERRFTLDYTMEQDSKSIAVHLTGTAYEEDGTAVPLDQSFLFDIENASPDNLPKWLNEDDLTDEYKEYLNFIFNYETVPMPAWLEELLEKY